MKRIYKNRFVILATIIALTFFTFGCDTGSSSSSGGVSDSDDPAATGPLSVCDYSSGLSNSGYASAEVFYPCDTSQGPFAATTMTGGVTNTKEDMEWLSTHIASHGFVVMAATPNNIYGTNPEWVDAHKGAVDMLIQENGESGSPIYNLVKTNAIQISGFSKGGGGTLLAASDVGSKIKTAQALAPYMDYSYDISGITVPTICYTGTADTIAPPGDVVDMFEALPTSITRTLAYFNSISHYDWYGSTGSYRDRMQTYIIGWMKVYLDDNNAFQQYIDGSQNWFYDFQSLDAGSSSSSSGGCN